MKTSSDMHSCWRHSWTKFCGPDLRNGNRVNAAANPNLNLNHNANAYPDFNPKHKP